MDIRMVKVIIVQGESGVLGKSLHLLVCDCVLGIQDGNRSWCKLSVVPTCPAPPLSSPSLISPQLAIIIAGISFIRYHTSVTMALPSE